MQVVIYGLFHNDECLYVGSTVDYESRIARHSRRVKNCGSCHIPKSIEWEPILLDHCSLSDRLIFESQYIEHLKPKYNVYRMKDYRYTKWNQYATGRLMPLTLGSEPH